MYKDEGECSEASMCHNFMAIIGSQKVSFERGISRIMALPFFLPLYFERTGASDAIRW